MASKLFVNAKIVRHDGVKEGALAVKDGKIWEVWYTDALTTEQSALRTSEELRASEVENSDVGEGTLFGWPRFDLAFFDATKMEYSSYLEAVLPLMKPGGLIVADNCLSHGRELAGFLKGIGEKGFLLPMDNGLLLTFKGW